jgi:hypothetical protein
MAPKRDSRDTQHYYYWASWSRCSWNTWDVTIPITAIDRLADDHIYLKLDKHTIAALPSGPVRRQQPSESRRQKAVGLPA